MTMKSKKQKSWEDGVKSFNAKTYLNKRKEVAVKGGKFKGPSHEEGGIDINVEGDEIMINETINNAASKHEKGLLALNENPDEFEIVRKRDARRRSFKLGGKA